MDFVEYPDRELLVMSLANNLAGDLRNALSNQDRVSFVVPGGTTPGPVFDSLCASDIEWERVDIMLSDERWVPSSSGRSNTRLIQQRLLVDRVS